MLDWQVSEDIIFFLIQCGLVDYKEDYRLQKRKYENSLQTMFTGYLVHFVCHSHRNHGPLAPVIHLGEG